MHSMRCYAIVEVEIDNSLRDARTLETVILELRESLGQMIPEHRPQVFLTKDPVHVHQLDLVINDIEDDVPYRTGRGRY